MAVLKANFANDGGIAPTQDPQSLILKPVETVLSFPPQYTLTNLHIWFIYVANTFFVKNQWRPTFVCGVQKAWKPYSDVLEFLYDYGRSHGTYKGLMSSILDNTKDLDTVVNYGEAIVTEWQTIMNQMDFDIEAFLQEVKLPAITKETEWLFSIWYDGKFEPTSHLHREAYKQRAFNSVNMSLITSMFLTMPISVQMLAHANITTSETHTHYWLYNEYTQMMECHCGKEETIQSRYQGSY